MGRVKTVTLIFNRFKITTKTYSKLFFFPKRVTITLVRNDRCDLRTSASDSLHNDNLVQSSLISPRFNSTKEIKLVLPAEGPQLCVVVLPQCAVHLQKAACAGRDWQRHDSFPGTLPFRDYSDVTLIPLHGWMLKNYRATNNSTSRVHILQVLVIL